MSHRIPSDFPLLSGPPPSPRTSQTEETCRKCNKEFNFLFARARKCNHCGYHYCPSCSDYSALMPRLGQASGYDSVHVCAYCIELLQITASGKSQLKALPIAKLRQYCEAYNIKPRGAVEKEDFVDAAVAARTNRGCLKPENEDYYRRNKVPKHGSTRRSRGFFGRVSNRMQDAASNLASPFPPRVSSPPPRPQTQYVRFDPQSGSFARPDLDPGRRTQQSTSRQQQPHHSHTATGRASYAASQSRFTPPPRPTSAAGIRTPTSPPVSRTPSVNLNVPPPQRARATSTPPAPPPRQRTQQPPQPTPTLDQLLEMPPERIAALSIGTLKAILFDNHVNARLILEKGDLVAKVSTLVDDERRERARRARDLEEEEERERMMREIAETEERERMAAATAEQRRREQDRGRGRRRMMQQATVVEVRDDPDAIVDGSESIRTWNSSDEEEDEETPGLPTVPLPLSTPPLPPPKAPPPLPPKASSARMPMATAERAGLCVICQDEEANIAIVDCGHLAMCRSCSNLVMQSSRECPLCRTRIVTEQRLLRIFKT